MQTQDPNSDNPSFNTNPNENSPSAKKETPSITLISVSLFIILALGLIVFLYNQNQQLKKIVAKYQNQALQTPTPSATPEAIVTPTISTPEINTLVKSPLKVTGTVPAGWMFEGVFPIKLVDLNNKTIIQAQAKENIDGSWQSEKPSSFSAVLTFKTSAVAGYIILQNDNPSGDEKKSKSFSIPVKFQETNDLNLTCPRSEYIDCMPTPDVGVKYECTPEALEWFNQNCPGFKGAAY